MSTHTSTTLVPDAELSFDEASIPVVRRVETRPRQPRATMALLISAHNEQLVLEQTLRSAIRAGMRPEHIYVVDDNSDDATSKIAKAVIPPNNVMKVSRSGKGLALTKAAKRFGLTERYRWIHIADADGGFSPNYFPIFRSKLRTKYAAATGYVRSLPGGTVSQYRVFEYTIGQEIHRRFQAMTHTVTVIPGPTSCFRADVFDKVNFANHSFTEDFDVTIQIHRMNLGRIQFIPQAMAYTQDPQHLSDFIKQITRWNRGIMQSFLRHRIGRHNQRVDAYLTYQLLQNFLFFASYFIMVPYVAIMQHSLNVVALTFMYDVAVLFSLVFLTAARNGRWDILSAFPQIYLYRMIALFVFMRAFFDVVVLRKFRIASGSWATEGRRYKQAVL
ncbi:MAG TPA: glycosyltransferase family 2 protein [Patescibacteria group bacterium]|nr:glycosyltransferase family 2 protein [Patescibacteria group bacterium]